MWGGTVLIHILPNVITRMTPDNAESSPLPDPHVSGERGLASLGERVKDELGKADELAFLEPSLSGFFGRRPKLRFGARSLRMTEMRRSCTCHFCAGPYARPLVLRELLQP